MAKGTKPHLKALSKKKAKNGPEKKVIQKKDYQIVVNQEKVSLLLKFPLQEKLELPTLKLDKENRILSSDQQYFLVRLSFKVETGQLLVPELSVSFSSSLRDCLPELSNYSSIPSLDKSLRTHGLAHSLVFIKEIWNFHRIIGKN